MENINYVQNYLFIYSQTILDLTSFVKVKGIKLIGKSRSYPPS